MVKTFLKARWENLIMANYVIDAELLMPFLPKGVELDLYDGKAYVSLVGFIFEHYYGYTKISENVSQEYKINHPRWMVNDVIEKSIKCDFSGMYGHSFRHLSNKEPDSVIIAEGSDISVDWKRQPF
jgi:hypothetical protein